ncbi:FAD-linked sulfhydryl oxidase ERV2 [Fulvia fulva]|uniref:Sulfhydryl oxidase n=1 Tax=Passalora fulva TaxID=5499 RepID=A0A9Q8LHJ5_PASFU|nr:FAD-linked sulfhydryl oxidase ERV2 [Fulvia fulva]KAK4615610.1 FAD-linked sulfhydryl oxidase ERV2 [Fulvia fulva]KAK4617085.1 FAD-linked sulfhydryl oxidase ERV2 [Fulvia fulva]UJO16748.1 FAD-linked sulfhydryl oxidase ERV2 [Fulvia fulva]WPV18958.1 FAD-linked sulfhydryl oxidase ERV2 [Fulvia fulva]WPV34503.1 FAD-linked sulfhydryl oxidase ERV2 [Fulvia fulva]
MPPSRGSSRRQVIYIIAAAVLLGITFISFFQRMPKAPDLKDLREALPDPGFSGADATITGPGGAIAPKLGNETAKAELGRATWKYFHTVMARFPDKPTREESTALKSFIYLFQRLYPCGECADHFGELLKKYPPQVSSRSAAAVWACDMHNKVNKRLGKEIFDCATIGDFYDCGCAEDEDTARAASDAKNAMAKPEMSSERREKLTQNGRDFDTDLLVAD